MYSFNQLATALDIVQDELIEHHLWDNQLSKIPVYWIPYSSAYGFQEYYKKGEIKIPAFSRSKFVELFGGQYTSLKDILRHEYAHAFAYTHKGLMRLKEFKVAFGAIHNDVSYNNKFEPEKYVSKYASTNSMEDFAETFMYYLEYSGRLPKKFNYPEIKKKWEFVKLLSTKLKSKQ
jgi:hypothetical protein